MPRVLPCGLLAVFRFAPPSGPWVPVLDCPISSFPHHCHNACSIVPFLLKRFFGGPTRCSLARRPCLGWWPSSRPPWDGGGPRPPPGVSLIWWWTPWRCLGATAGNNARRARLLRRPPPALRRHRNRLLLPRLPRCPSPARNPLRPSAWPAPARRRVTQPEKVRPASSALSWPTLHCW